MLAIRTILVGVDFTETSDRAVDYATGLAEKLDASVVVMHAYEIPIYGFPEGALVASGEIAARLSIAAQRALDAMVESRAKPGLRLHAMLRTGNPYEETNRAADEIGADLIVIGTHGRRGLARALLGSIAENVIRTATRPVLVIHGPRTHA